MPEFNVILQTLGLPARVVGLPGLGSGLPQAGSPVVLPDNTGRFGTNLVGDGPDLQPLSYLGTPVFADVRFPAANAGAGLALQTVLIEITQTKNIVKTAIQGRNGTQKEYIADGDYEVSIRGAIVGADGSFPRADVRALIQLLQSPAAIQVVADYLRLFDIYTIVVESYRFFQQEGMENMQFFEVAAVSDAPIELIADEDVTPQ